ncbi:MAG: bifunctional enoyl-CoA hydratase/phosphate acetyltransferase [Solobacterium sp.]|nr:bifunctional enoyl-CoA hydratase/phosphate acetyltransferase [Solobacterium sp.]
MLKDFEEIRQTVLSRKHTARLGVIGSDETHTLEAVVRAARDGMIVPVLFGDEEGTREKWNSLNSGLSLPEIIHCEGDEDIAKKAVTAAHDGRVDALLKGKIQTAVMLKAVLNKEWGLRTGRKLSHVMLMHIPSYHKLMFMTDGGMTTYPDLNDKVDLIHNAVDVAHKLGYEEPKVAVLSSVEYFNPKMPENVDADALKKMNQNGEITGCIIEGPISIDLAVSKESAEIKDYHSPVAGDADVLVMPDLPAGNIFFKSLYYFAGMSMAGVIVGASVPLSMLSRSSGADEKYYSILLAAAAAA